MELALTLTTISTGINIVLVLGLLFVYVRSYAKLRSGFTIGLMVFAALFLIQNAVAFYYYFTMMPYFVEDVQVFALILSVLQTLAFAVMNWITWK